MEFDALQELVRVITRNKVKNIEVLGNPGQSGRVEEFYDLIAKGKLISDEEASKKFFNADPKSANYKRLKNQLIRQLANTAFFIDNNLPMYSERASAYYNSYHDFVAALILNTKEAKKASIHLAELALVQAIKFEFVELAADITRHLRTQYGRTQGDVKKHEYFAELHRNYEEKRRWQMMSLDYYENLINYYLVKQSPNEDVNKMATDYLNQLEALKPNVDTSSFLFHYYCIGIIKYFSESNWTKALPLIDEGIEALTAKTNSTGSGQLGALGMNRLFCLTQLRKFDNNEGEKTLEFCLKHIVEGGFNWFRAMETYFQYCIYVRRYEQALEIYNKTTMHPSFRLQNPTMMDTWRIFKGYLHLLAEIKVLPSELVTKVCGPFRDGRYYNEFEVADKDKEGMNIPLVMLPILYCLVRGQFQEYGRSVTALEAYRKRYLNNELNRRSSAFFRILMAYDQMSFEPEKSQKRIQKELDILMSQSPEITRQSVVVEIIPYEDLWDMLTIYRKY